MLTIPKAAKRVQCSAMEIVRLVLDRTLKNVARLAQTPGYAAVLVDAAELRSHVGKPPLPGMSARQVIIELGASHATVRALIDNGVLPAKRAINPVGHTPVSLVARADLDAFRRKYVTLAHLAKAHRKQPRAMRLELERRGIHPAPELDKQTYEVIFYRRADLEA